MNLNKSIKGTAKVFADGGFSFTPHTSLSESEKKVKLIYRGRYSSLWVGTQTVSARLVFSRKNIPSFAVWVEELTVMYNQLIKDLE